MEIPNEKQMTVQQVRESFNALHPGKFDGAPVFFISDDGTKHKVKHIYFNLTPEIELTENLTVDEVTAINRKEPDNG